MATNEENEVDQLFADFVLSVPTTGFVPPSLNDYPLPTDFSTSHTNNHVLSTDIPLPNDLFSTDSLPLSIEPSHSPPNINNIQPLAVVPRRSTRTHKPHTFLQDYHCNLLLHQHNPSHTSHSIQKFLSYDRLLSSHKTFVFNVSTSYEPSFYHQGVKFSHWRGAMDEEIGAMERTNT